MGIPQIIIAVVILLRYYTSIINYSNNVKDKYILKEAERSIFVERKEKKVLRREKHIYLWVGIISITIFNISYIGLLAWGGFWG